MAVGTQSNHPARTRHHGLVAAGTCLALFGLAAFATGGVAQTTAPPPSSPEGPPGGPPGKRLGERPDERSPGLSPDLGARVEAWLGPIVREDLISGTVLIAQNGQVLLSQGYGPADREQDRPNTPQTKFRLGSLSKQFTAAAILVLEQQGRLRVDDPLARYYPEFPRAGEITLHHLLSHTSGIPNYNQRPDYGDKMLLPWTIEQVVSWMRPDSLEFDPGERFSYSNSNYVLLAGIIERVSGQTYARFLQEAIFAPAGMNDTGQDLHTRVLPHRATGHVSFGEEVERAPYRDMPFMSGAGSLYSTALDLLRWDQALYTDRILTAESRQKMFTPHSATYGYGWFVEDRGGHRCVSHRGEINGFIVSLDRYVDDRIVVVSLFNYESVFARRAIRGLCELALGGEPPPFLSPQLVPVSNELLRAYAGTYLLSGSDTLRVAARDGTLRVRATGQPHDLAAVAQSESMFWVRGLKSMIRFDRDESGAVARLVLFNSVHAVPGRRV